MSVAPEEIAQVRAATDIVALIGEHVALRKTGQRWTGLCPFHEEKTPSFSVNAEEGLYYCFGCQASGDAITFVRETQHLDFIDALRQLAERAGIQLHEDRDADGGGWRDKSVLYDAVERAVAWYHERLLVRTRRGPRARLPPQPRLRRRHRARVPARLGARRLGPARPRAQAARRGGLDGGTRVREQGAVGSRTPCARGCSSRSSIRAVARSRSAGASCPVAGGTPASGRVEPKYKNTQETPIYQKRKTLYGLNWAKQDVVATSEIVVCEGYTDVIAFFGAGRAAARSRRAAPPSPRTTSA